jgi:exodeoxyribonuclease VII large subunit
MRPIEGFDGGTMTLTEEDPRRNEAGNLAELSVTELSMALKRTVEDRFGLVRVRGEISGYRGAHSSGHCYFALKDDRSRLEAVIWRGSFSRLQGRMQEGLEVIATGKLTTYPGTSKYQIVVENLEPAGAGALMALLEERKRKLAAEGLFAEDRKQLLPALPMVIGVVTSPTGAVIRDVLHRISERFPLHVIVWPVRVQGETSGMEVAAAIRGFNALSPGGPVKRPDLIIVARGGGSIEDLWGFNDEAVVRAAADSMIPLISAVGHETDWTLIDLAADRRAPTPTGAAEIAVPVKADLEARIAAFTARLRAGASRSLERARSKLLAARRGLGTADAILAAPRQRFDAASARLATALELAVTRRRRAFATVSGRLSRRQLENRIGWRRQAFETLDRRLANSLRAASRRKRDELSRLLPRLAPLPLEWIAEKSRQRLELAARRSSTAFARNAEKQRQRFDGIWRLVVSLSHESVLERGFALLRDASGNAVTSAAQVAPGDPFRVDMRDGTIEATARRSSIGRKHAKPSPARRQDRPKGEQGDLF